MMSPRALPFASLALLAAGAAPAAEQVTLNQDLRRLEGMIDSCSGMSEKAAAADAITEPFDSSFSARYTDGDAFADGEVTITSGAPTAAGFSGEGRAALTRRWPGCVRAADLESHFGYSFHVSSPVHYRLTGSVASNQATFYTWSAVQLTKTFGDIGIEIQQEHEGTPEGVDFDDTGILPEGNYFLAADAVIIDESDAYAGTAEYKVTLSFEEGCRADCTKDGVLNVNDFICFQTEWRKKTAYGDYNGDGVWNVNDFIAYQAGWRAGCK